MARFTCRPAKRDVVYSALLDLPLRHLAGEQYDAQVTCVVVSPCLCCVVLNEHHADDNAVVNPLDDLLGSGQYRGADLSVVGDVEHEGDRLALGRTRIGRSQYGRRQDRPSRQDLVVVRHLVSLRCQRRETAAKT